MKEIKIGKNLRIKAVDLKDALLVTNQCENDSQPADFDDAPEYLVVTDDQLAIAYITKNEDGEYRTANHYPLDDRSVTKAFEVILVDDE